MTEVRDGSREGAAGQWPSLRARRESNEGLSGSVSPYAVVVDGRNAGDGVPYGVRR